MSEQLEFFPITDPCFGKCQFHEGEYCHYCFRKRSESLNWNRMSDSEKRDVLRRCIIRRTRLQRILKRTNEEPDLQQSLF